jgi:hypothetical protein
MNTSAQTMTRYLLGELPDSQQAALEEKYFTDPKVFDDIVKAENELVDNYARGLLNPESREKFEQYYLAHSKRRERAEFAQTLVTKVDQFETDRSGTLVREVPWWRRIVPALSGGRRAFAFSMSLALLLLLLGLGALFFKTRRAQEELARNQAAHAAQEQRDRELQQQLANERTRINDHDELNRARPQATSSPPEAPAIHATPAFVTLLLTAGGIRGSDTALAPEIIIPTGTEQVHIQLNLRETDYSNYHVVLQAVGGKTIFSRQGVKPKATKSGSTFVIIVPARTFAAGDYILTLRGVRPDAEVDDVSKSLFRVTKK